MAARSKTVIVPAGCPALELAPLAGAAGAAGIWIAKDSPQLFPVTEYDEVYAESQDSEGGLRTRSRPKNAVGAISVVVAASTQAAFEGYYRTLQSTVEALRKGGVVEYTPAESAVTTSYQVASARLSEVPYDGTQMLAFVQMFTVEVTCLPYGVLPQVAATLRSHDAFSVDTVNKNEDWPADAGTPANLTFAGPGMKANTTKTVLRRRGLALSDGTVQVKFKYGAIVGTKAILRATGRRVASNEYVFARMSSESLKVVKVRAGVETTIAEKTFTPTTGTKYWLQLVMAGNVLTARLFASDPALGGAALLEGSAALAGEDATKLGSGVWGAVGFGIEEATANTTVIEDWMAWGTTLRGSYAALAVEVPSVPGDVDALGDLTVTDVAAKGRRHVEGGVASCQNYSLALAPPTWVSGAMFGGSPELKMQNLSSIVKSYGLASLNHVGPHRLKAVVKAPAVESHGETYWLRAAWRNQGSSKARRGEWARVASAQKGLYSEVDLGIVTPSPPAAGESGWELYFDAYVEGTAAVRPLGEFSLLGVIALPADRWWKSRAAIDPEQPAAAYLWTEKFSQPAAALTAVVAEGSGSGSYAAFTGSDADDFQVTGGGVATRTAVSDSGTIPNANKGRAVGNPFGGGVELSKLAHSIMTSQSAGGSATAKRGLLMRLGAVNSFLVTKVSWGGGSTHNTESQVVIAGALSSSTSNTLTVPGTGESSTIELLQVVAPGGWYAVYLNGLLAEVGAIAGAPKVNGAYIYDEQSGAGACTRTYDSWLVWEPETDYAINMGGSARFRSADAIRLDALGRWGLSPGFEGSRLRVPPAGPGNNAPLLAVKSYVRDADEIPLLAASELEDAFQVSLNIQPRVAVFG